MNYEQIFNQRGGLYHHAMQAWPEIRAHEFETVLSYLPLCRGSSLLDVPAGGGYLKHYLPDYVDWTGHEPCQSFQPLGSQSDSLLPLAFANGHFDAVASVAGVHHLTDKLQLWQEVFRVLKPGGSLVVMDVYENSPTARFLDEFVGRFNQTGHEGIYLNSSSVSELCQVGFERVSQQTEPVEWRALNATVLARFCMQLFGLEGVNLWQVKDGLQQYLGWHKQGASVRLEWPMYSIKVIKPVSVRET